MGPGGGESLYWNVPTLSILCGPRIPEVVCDGRCLPEGTGSPVPDVTPQLSLADISCVSLILWYFGGHT